MLLSLVAIGCSSEGDDVVRSDDTWDTRGALLAWDGEVWIVDDQPLVVPVSLGVDHQRVLGATVDATGTFDASGRRVTEAINISDGEWPDSSLPAETIEGTIDGVDDSTSVWTVGDHHVVVPSGVRVHDAPDLGAFAPGDTVTIAGHRLDDNRIVALDITLSESSASSENGDSDRQSEAPFDPAVFITPPTDDGTTATQADGDDDDDDNDKPDDRRNKEKDKKKKEKDRD